MREKRLLSAFFFLAITLYALNLFLFCASQSPSSEQLLVQNTYFGPTEEVPGNPKLIFVEVQVHDSPDRAGGVIKNASFDGRSIPLKPREIYGRRGKASFQLPPGKYSLRWTVIRDTTHWPRTQSFEEEVTLDPQDFWVQIMIEGDFASIL